MRDLTSCVLAGLLTLTPLAGCTSSSGAGGSGGSAGAGEGGTGGGAIGGAGGGETPIFEGEVTNLVEALAAADFVFEGEVVAIEYANATNNGTGGPDPDDADDSGVVPHTFVTYRIAEDFSGNGQSDAVTMRFIGGVDATTGPDYDILQLAQGPRFDIGDRDIVLMRGNTETGCPMVGCSDGRFRILESPEDDRPYIFTEFAQEVRLIDDGDDEGHLWMVGDHRIPDIFTHSVALPDGEIALFTLASEDEVGEPDPTLQQFLVPKHSFEPRGDLSPLDEPAEAFDAQPAGIRLDPDQFRALIRKAIVDHPDFVWLPYVDAVSTEPFAIVTFADVPGPTNDDDPVVDPPDRTSFEIAEAEAITDEDLEADLQIDPALAFDIQMRRQQVTGVTESPNRKDEESLAEDMWEEER